MSEQQFNREVDRALKYSREKLPVSAIHPSLRFTRLGAVLREHATEDSTVGSLAHAALTQPHDQPLELMPLHALRDFMQDYPEHPLASRFNWGQLPEKVALDETTRAAVGEDRWLWSRMANPSAYSDRHLAYNKFRQIRDLHPWAEVTDVQDSARRVSNQHGFGVIANVDQTPEGWHDELARDNEVTALPTHISRY